MLKTINYKGLEIITNDISFNKPILFIHGNSLDARTFSKQFQHLNDLSLAAINLPGHGNSFKPVNPVDTYNFYSLTEIISKLITGLNISNPILAGHSLGGHLAIECLDTIESIKGIVIFGTPPISLPPKLEEMYLPNLQLASFFKENLTPTEVELLANEIARTNTTELKEIVNYITNTDPNFRKHFAQSINEGKFKDELKLINQTKIPSMVIHGVNDQIVNTNYLKQINNTKLYNNKINLIENASHSPQLESHEEFNKLLREFYINTHS